MSWIRRIIFVALVSILVVHGFSFTVNNTQVFQGVVNSSDYVAPVRTTIKPVNYSKSPLESKQKFVHIIPKDAIRKGSDPEDYSFYDMFADFMDFLYDSLYPPVTKRRSKVKRHTVQKVTPNPIRRRTQKGPEIKKKKIKKTVPVTSGYGDDSEETSFENKLPQQLDSEEIDEDEDEDEIENDPDEDETEDDEDTYDEFFMYGDDEYEDSNEEDEYVKRPEYTFEDNDEDYNDQDSVESYNYDDRNPTSGTYTKWTFSSLLMEFINEVYFRIAGDTLDDDDDDEDDIFRYSSRMTTPRMSDFYRKPKKPSYNQFMGFFSEDEPEVTRQPLEKKESKWIFDSWFNSDPSTTIATTTEQMITELTPTEAENWNFLDIFNARSTESTSETTADLEPMTTSIPIPATDQQSTQPTITNEVFNDPKISYKNYQLWRLKPINDDQVKFLQDLRRSTTKYQWWQGPSLEGKTDIIVPPEEIEVLQNTLDGEGIKFTPTTRDLQLAVQYSDPQMTRREQFQLEAVQGHPLTWYHYHKFADVMKFLEFMQRNYPKNVDLIHIGRSFEGRPLVICHLFSRHHSNAKKKRSAFIESGLMGHEWIGPAVTSWIVNEFSKDGFRFGNYSNSDTSWDLYLMPIANPDGYEYSHTKDRLWMKNRSTRKPTKKGVLSKIFSWWKDTESQNRIEGSDTCVGVNLNRNFDYNWNNVDGLDFTNACSQDYSGEKAFSEPESKALGKFLLKIATKLRLYISLRSYGQIISLPLSKSRMKKYELTEMAENALSSLKAHSPTLARYFVDDDSSMSYSKAGSITSFTHNELGVDQSFMVKLRDTGENGFLLPPSYIETTARESLQLIQAFIENSV